ncbi:MAG: LruC domain-containing protein [Leptospiraceae bacterium]|nr:LruC domain-containing protein [Leptospiraceae bacterium]
MKILIQIILILSLMLGCQSRDKNDPVYLWLLSSLTQNSLETNSNSTLNSSNTLTSNFSMDVNDISGNPEFLFNNFEEVNVEITIQDAFNTDVTPIIRIMQYTEEVKMNLFTATPDPSGNVSGSFSYDINSPHAILELIYNGETFTYDIDLTGLVEINRIIKINGNVVQVVIVDSDSDGIPDSEDLYPNDPTRSSMVKTSGSSYLTVAYEDLYPKQGDADFNDYVVRVSTEEDLDSMGKVKRIRGSYEHVAKGAGYNHKLFFRLPDGVSGTYTLKRFSSDGNLEETISGNLNNDIEILPESKSTLPTWNSKKGETPSKGKKAELEIILDQSIDKKLLSMSPYDLFLFVINTGHEIHFLGKYKNEDGTDNYLDQGGFPWAISIPGIWQHPYESTDIRNSYSNFKNWYESRGSNYNDWYLTPNTNYVFPVVE